eukprot:5610475-Prymnesium_polylepis.2
MPSSLCHSQVHPPKFSRWHRPSASPHAEAEDALEATRTTLRWLPATSKVLPTAKCGGELGAHRGNIFCPKLAGATHASAGAWTSL